MENIRELSLTDLRRLFNVKYKSNIKLTNESIKSVTPYKIADSITFALIRIYYDKYKACPLSIMDATANVGGNCISFANKFPYVYACEIKPRTKQILDYNIKSLRLNNVLTLCKDFNTHVYNLQPVDIVFLDPPWFIDEIFNTNMALSCELKPRMTPIEETIFRIWHRSNSMIAIKVPKKYKTHIREYKRISYKKMDILIFFKN